MSEERFLKLVEGYQGFEFCQAYRDDEDHILGGKDNVCWYVIMKKGKVKEFYTGTLRDDGWEDVLVKGSGKSKKTKVMPAGSTIRRIAEKAYLMQEEKWVKDRKGKLIEDAHPHFHYTYGFGEKALDVSEKYGVTIAYSDINDVPAGFHLRDLSVGEEVVFP
ncbi:MAG: hypothetical protein IKR59_01705 [Lachnospiraceae bacterium]|nr:hypothetical protein [Lachnospiraceae bacterium]